MESSKVVELVEKIESLIPSGNNKFREDIKSSIKVLIEDYLHKIDLVTREEFDIQQEVLLKTRLKIDHLS